MLLELLLLEWLNIGDGFDIELYFECKADTTDTFPLLLLYELFDIWFILEDLFISYSFLEVYSAILD